MKYVLVVLFAVGITLCGEAKDTGSGTSEIVSGRLSHKVDPKYPKEETKNKIYGSTVVEITVAKNGSVKDISILDGDIVLAEAAVDAVQKWKFEPYMQNGGPAEVRQKLRFTFLPRQKLGQLDTPLSPPTLATGWLSEFPIDLSSDTIYRVGYGGVRAPKALYTPDPGYSERARSEGYQGDCILSLILGKNGEPRDIQVVSALGEGLDLKAVEAVKTWRFQPATKDGQPVAVFVTVTVSFHIP